MDVAKGTQSHVSHLMIFVWGTRSGESFLLLTQLLLKLDLVMFQGRCPFFTSDMLEVTAFMAAQLLPAHTEYLATYMGRNA